MSRNAFAQLVSDQNRDESDREESARERAEVAAMPTYGQLKAQVAVYRAEIEAVRRSAPAVMLTALREIAAAADLGCAVLGGDYETLASIRRLALNAISDGKDEPCAPRT